MLGRIPVQGEEPERVGILILLFPFEGLSSLFNDALRRGNRLFLQEWLLEEKGIVHDIKFWSRLERESVSLNSI